MPSGPSGALHTSGALLADGARCVVSKPGQARPPARLGVLTSFGAAPRSPPVPSGPSGALHACHTNFACNSLVTISNVEFIALKSQRFQTLLNLHPIELHATFLRPGPATARRCRGLALRLEVGSVPLVSATLGVLPGVA